MNRASKIAAASALIALFAASCSGEHSATPIPPAPLAEAFPRLPLPLADSLVAVSGSAIRVNPAAHVVSEPTPDRKATAITVSYPGLGAHIYYTLRPVKPSEMKSVVDNRLERMSLNLAGTPARTIHTASDSPLEGLILTARSGSQTPVQILVVGNDFVVSGSAFIDDARASSRYDSIRPLIDMLHNDMARAVPSAIFVKQ